MNGRRAPLLALALGMAVAAAAAGMAALASGDPSEEPLIDDRRARIFAQACAHCHVRPGIGVPVLGDEAEWQARRADGFESLVAHTVEGFGQMPPLGTCSYCSEDDLRRLTAFVAGYSSLPGREETPR